MPVSVGLDKFNVCLGAFRRRDISHKIRSQACHRFILQRLLESLLRACHLHAPIFLLGSSARAAMVHPC